MLERPRVRRATALPALFGAALSGALLLAAQVPAAAQDAAGPPDGHWFALEHVLDVAVEMAPADWDRLRRQTRTMADLFGGSECLAQPFAQIFSWFAADVTVDGVRYGEVGVRKKGFLGSLSEEKPSLKLRFDRYVDDQALGGVLERVTLNNSVQDPSLLNTCLAYQVFAAAGLPAPRCNFASVTVNGDRLGLYVQVEDVEASLLERVFPGAAGTLYEGTVSDFRPGFRGTFERKTGAGGWSAVDAVTAALQDPSPAGREALAAAVDLDRFLTFWAAEVLVGHWDGYAGNRNNYYVYAEPGGQLAFIPWGVDQTFTTTDSPFDDFVSPPSVMAHGAIAHRLYRDEAGRAAYAARLRELLDTVWDEAELLRRSERMAAIVQAHELAERRAEAARDADRVRRFIRERRAEILADLEPEPPDWPWPPVSADLCWGEPISFELWFETTWGTKESADPFAAGTVTRYLLDGAEQPVELSGATAGWAGPEEAAQMGVEQAAVITLMRMGADFAMEGITAWLPPERAAPGARVVIGEQGAGGVTWSLPPGATEPGAPVPITAGGLELDAAGTEPGAAVTGRFSGTLWGLEEPAAVSAAAGAAGEQAAVREATGLVINEVAARGEPRDWFELYNAGPEPLALADFVLADDLTDRGKRTPFPPGLIIEPGAYLRIELDGDGWPGFALGRDEELGIWTADGRLAAQVDWAEGQSDDGASFARVPDVTGPFRTVTDPTPGAPNVSR